jgi:hypothetical protein
LKTTGHRGRRKAGKDFFVRIVEDDSIPSSLKNDFGNSKNAI